jgi:FMN phosphatase YigB (HAD superfamily)
MILPKYIVFDVAGLLLDIRQGQKIMSQHFKVTPSKLEKVFNKYRLHADLGIITPEKLWHNIAVDLKSDNTDGKKLLDIYLSCCFPLRWGYDLALWLRSYNYRLAICTNVWSGISKRFWPHVTIAGDPIFSIFENVIESCVVKAVKPDSAIFNIVEKTIGACGQSILLIDDTLENVDSAKSFGWQAFKYELRNDYGWYSCIELRAMLIKR